MPPLITIIMYIYPILCVFVPCLVYQLFLYSKRNRHEKLKIENLIWRYVFILYLYLVMRVVGMGSIWEIGKYGSIIRCDEINLIPFQSEGSEGLLLYILNIIMLMPLGFLLPLMWEKYRSITKTIALGALFSFSIEIGQLFNRRKTDIDDLLMNVLGTILGFCIWLLFNKLFKTKPKDLHAYTDEPFVYLSLSVLCTFFLYNWRWFFAFVL